MASSAGGKGVGREVGGEKGAALGGLLGVLTALPLAAALRVFTLRVVAPTERDMVGAGPGA